MLLDMVEAYGKRRARELQEIGLAFNLAMHAPKRLKQLGEQSGPEPVNPGRRWWGDPESNGVNGRGDPSPDTSGGR